MGISLRTQTGASKRDVTKRGSPVSNCAVERVEASFRASPDGPLTEEKTRILFESQASVKGLALADPAFAQAVGRELTLNMRGSVLKGEATFDVLDLSAPSFNAQYSGLLSRSKIHGKATIVARDDVETYVLGKADFRAVIESSASLRDQLYRVYFVRH